MADSRYKNNNAGDIVNGPDGAVRKQKVAVALQYNKGEQAPKIIASGKGHIADKIIAGRTSLCPRSFHPFKGFHPTHPPLFAAPDASAAVLPTPAFAPVLEQWHLQNPFPAKTPPAEILPAVLHLWSV